MYFSERGIQANKGRIPAWAIQAIGGMIEELMAKNILGWKNLAEHITKEIDELDASNESRVQLKRALKKHIAKQESYTSNISPALEAIVDKACADAQATGREQNNDAVNSQADISEADLNIVEKYASDLLDSVYKVCDTVIDSLDVRGGDEVKLELYSLLVNALDEHSTLEEVVDELMGAGVTVVPDKFIVVKQDKYIQLLSAAWAKINKADKEAECVEE